MADATDPAAWFAALSGSTKRHLVSDPIAPVPSDLIEEVCKAGAALDFAHHLLPEYRNYLLATKLHEDLANITAELRRERAKYFPIADPVEGVREPEAPFDSLADAALKLLEAKQRDLAEAYRLHVDVYKASGFTGEVTY